jgi:two-component system sensor histidine kinase/response regulator
MIELSSGRQKRRDKSARAFSGIAMRSKKPEQETPAARQQSDPVAGGPLFAAMDHQIHTSMNGVIGMLELLRGTQLNAAQSEFTEMAQASAEQLLKLFGSMIDFSRISSGGLALERLPFDLFREVEQACGAHQYAARQKGLALKIHSAPDIQRLMVGDAARIGQVISTLLGNAIDRSSDGEVRVDIDAIAQHDGRCRLSVCISDSCGSAADQLAGIFGGAAAPQLANDAQTDPGQLGLALCKSLIELMDGQCGADCRNGQGNKFWFSLNLPLALSVLKGVRILLLDDQPVVCRVFEQQLGQHAMRADCFNTASAAMGALFEAKSADDPYRIAILNHQMAEMDGETLGAAIKADPAYRDTLLVILSPESSAAQAERFARAGFSASIAKPVNRQTLLDTLAILCACLSSGRTPPFVVDAVIHSLSSPQDSAQGFAGNRVLVVDDNLSNYQIAERMLEKLGCTADVASDGHAAVAMHNSAPYDLILMDCQMPGLDGYQASVMIRATEAGLRHTPIVAWTTNTTPQERKKCAASGMDDLIAKPLRMQTLHETLSRWLQPSTGAAETVEAGPSDELESMRDLFGSSFVELAALYQDDVPKRLAALQTAAQASDASQMARTAHSLSGSCASIGATRLAAMCQDLEQRCKAGMIDDHEPRLGAIRAEFGRIQTKLDAMVQSMTV